MYITNSSGCNSGGVWETVVSSKNWALVNSGDGTGTVYAKFRNASSASNCVSHRVAVTATPLAVEGASCSGLTAQIAARGTGVYLIDPDGAGSLPAENHYCNMDYMGGGWTVVTRTFASNTNIANSIPSTAEYLSTSTVGSLAGHKYVLGNNRQGFANWGAVVNGVSLNPVSDFNGNLQKYSSYVGGTTARTCTWQNGSGDFVIGTTAGGACLKFTSGANGTWWGASDGSVNATLWIQGSTFNLNSTTVFPPFNLGIINGEDNDYCSVMQNGTKTFGHGYTCRQGGLGSQQVAQSDYIEVLAKNAAPTVYVLTSGASVTVPSGKTSVKIWVVGGGGGGAGSATSDDNSGGGGGAGGIAYKTFTVSSGQAISYSLGAAGSQGSNFIGGGNGGTTSATVAGMTIYGYGGSGGIWDNGDDASGGTFAGGDGGVNGGSGLGVIGDTGGGSGGAIGGTNGTTAASNGANGANSVDVSGLFAALSYVSGYPTTSGGGASPTNSSSMRNLNHGLPATGFGCGGGSAGFWGGNGGNGLYGGGGGGASGYSAVQTGGAGGQGVVVMQFN
jgi:hypothetical protein